VLLPYQDLPAVQVRLRPFRASDAMVLHTLSDVDLRFRVARSTGETRDDLLGKLRWVEGSIGAKLEFVPAPGAPKMTMVQSNQQPT
jgi:hypothetical protein